MATFAVSIVKRARYHGEDREFGNTYHFSTATSEPFDDQGCAERVADLERNITQSNVEFVRWQTWGPTDGSAAENVIRADGNLDGPGLAVVSPGTYREVCALVTWQLPRSPVLNRKRFLRKFLRMPGYVGQLNTNILAGADPLTADAIAYFETEFCQPIRFLQFGLNEYSLSTAEGDFPTDDGTVRPFLFTRQIGA